ncbi:MAG: DUF4340 domain-containing protein, partial [Spirochaetaceae bacterium]|nr:DUF4340 domain-containing protein [Spirochaetaceae bacterium]
MKNKKKLILPLVLAVLLIIYGLTTLATRQVVTDDEAVTTTPSVTNVHSAPGLTAFTINRGDTSFRFAHDESGWRLAGEPLPINPFVLSQMAFTASNVMAAQIIEAAEALPLSIYGLDTPIFIEVEAEQNFTLAIGAPTPSGLAYYVMVSGSNNVYVVNNFYLDQFFGSLESFLEVRLQPLDFTQLNRIEIENRFGRIVLALNPRTDDRLWTSWLMTEPYVNAMIDSFNTEQAFLQYWLQRFTFMRQNMRVRPNMAEFGLANPQGRITFSTHNGESISLALGDVAQTDVAYWVRANDEDIIFTLDSETVEAALNLRPFDVISRFVALYNIDLIESIEFTYQNSHFRGVINGVLYEAGTTF